MNKEEFVLGAKERAEKSVREWLQKPEVQRYLRENHEKARKLRKEVLTREIPPDNVSEETEK